MDNVNMLEQTKIEQTNDLSLDLLDDINLPEKEKEVNPDEEKYIINSKRIDAFTTKRIRVRLTPAVCDVCGIDVILLGIEQGKLPEESVYEKLPENVQLMLQQLIQRHKLQSHSTAENLIISKSQKSRKWLSGRNG